MALGFGKKADDESPPPAMSNQSEFGKEQYYDGFGRGDEETGGVGRQSNGGRKMSRIDKPVTQSISGQGGLTDDDASDPSVSVGKQMELEAGNAIKYRTCSWQKV